MGPVLGDPPDSLLIATQWGMGFGGDELLVYWERMGIVVIVVILELTTDK